MAAKLLRFMFFSNHSKKVVFLFLKLLLIYLQTNVKVLYICTSNNANN